MRLLFLLIWQKHKKLSPTTPQTNLLFIPSSYSRGSRAYISARVNKLLSPLTLATACAATRPPTRPWRWRASPVPVWRRSPSLPRRRHLPSQRASLHRRRCAFSPQAAWLLLRRPMWRASSRPHLLPRPSAVESPRRCPVLQQRRRGRLMSCRGFGGGKFRQRCRPRHLAVALLPLRRPRRTPSLPRRTSPPAATQEGGATPPVRTGLPGSHATRLVRRRLVVKQGCQQNFITLSGFKCKNA